MMKRMMMMMMKVRMDNPPLTHPGENENDVRKRRQHMLEECVFTARLTVHSSIVFFFLQPRIISFADSCVLGSPTDIGTFFHYGFDPSIVSWVSSLSYLRQQSHARGQAACRFSPQRRGKHIATLLLSHILS